jgi:uncharacterized protein YjbJ (UPF0337 family)
MNMNIIEGEWKELKGKIRAKWGKFTEDDLENMKGNIEKIKGKIQQSYGRTKDQAEDEFNEFMKSVKKKTKQ